MISRFHDLLPGALVGGYQIEAALAVGGMGAVYTAKHLVLPRRVAIKVLHAHVLGCHSAAARLLQEASILASIEGPTVVHVYDAGTLADGRPWVAMELLGGHTLAYLLHEQRRLPAREAARIVRAIAEALAVAHAHGIVHCDIKPENVIVCGDDVKVIDWGIARIAKRQIGIDDNVTGTPQYMAPEQIHGGVIDARTDVYALGVVGYELLVGDPPFSSNHAATTALAHLFEPPQRIGRRVPNLPSAFDELLRSMRAILPDERPSIAAVRACLDDVIDQIAQARSPEVVIDLDMEDIDQADMVASALSLGMNDGHANTLRMAWTPAVNSLPIIPLRVSRFGMANTLPAMPM